MGEGSQASLFDPTEPRRPRQRFADNTVAVREVRCKSLLNRCKIDDYSFNCYVSCAHGCRYCYARFMQRFHPHAEDWGRFVDVKVNAADVLARQLHKLKPGDVFTCSACDGWQPTEQQNGLTRECCRSLLDAGFRLNILTKSRLVLLDLDIFAGRDVRLGVTITTLDEADVGRIQTDTLNPRPRVWPSVQEVMRRHRADLLERYRCLLFDRAGRLVYKRQLDMRIRRAAKNAGLASRLS